MSSENPQVSDAGGRRDRTGWIIGACIIGVVVIVAAVLVFAWLERLSANTGHIRCASNLRQIGYACRMYSMSEERYPPDLETAYREGELEESVFICDEEEGVAPGPPPFVLGVNCSYGYLGEGLTDTADYRDPLAHCFPGNHDGEGAFVVFADGSVRVVRPEELETLIPGIGDGKK